MFCIKWNSSTKWNLTVVHRCGDNYSLAVFSQTLIRRQIQRRTWGRCRGCQVHQMPWDVPMRLERHGWFWRQLIAKVKNIKRGHIIQRPCTACGRSLLRLSKEGRHLFRFISCFWRSHETFLARVLVFVWQQAIVKVRLEQKSSPILKCFLTWLSAHRVTFTLQ